MWFLLHYKSHSFNVRGVDTGICMLFDWVNCGHILPKQNIILPKQFRDFINSPYDKVELIDDSVIFLIYVGVELGQEYNRHLG